MRARPPHMTASGSRARLRAANTPTTEEKARFPNRKVTKMARRLARRLGRRAAMGVKLKRAINPASR